MRTGLLTFLLVALTVSASAQQPPTTPGTDPTPDGPTAAESARRSQVIARIGDVRITVGDAEDTLNQQAPFLRERYRQDPARLRKFVVAMIDFELQARAAETEGYGARRGVIRQVKQTAVQALINQEFDERIRPETVEEADVRSYFEAHSDEFFRPEMVRAGHILLGSRSDAAEVLGQLRAADTDLRKFRRLARERSIDTETKMRGGDLRFFTRDGRPPGARDAPVHHAVVDAAFTLSDVGELVSAPVEVGENFSVVQLWAKRAEVRRAYEDAEEGIRRKLWRQQRQEAIENFVTGLRTRLHPTIHTERIQAIQLEVAPTKGGDDGHGHGRHGGESPEAPGMGPSNMAAAEPQAAPGMSPAAPSETPTKM